MIPPRRHLPKNALLGAFAITLVGAVLLAVLIGQGSGAAAGGARTVTFSGDAVTAVELVDAMGAANVAQACRVLPNERQSGLSRAGVEQAYVAEYDRNAQSNTTLKLPTAHTVFLELERRCADMTAN